MRRAQVVFAVLGALCFPIAAAAQIKPTSPVFVLDLFDPQNRFVVLSAQSFDDALRDPSVRKISREEAALTPAGADSPLDRIVSSCSGTGPGTLLNLAIESDRAHPVAKLQKCMDCLKAFEEKRYVTQRNDQIALIVLFNAATVKREEIQPLFQETKRQSELFATGKAMFELLRAEATPILSCAAFTYTLQHERSRLKVQLPLPKGAIPTGDRTTPAPAAAPVPAAGSAPAAAGPVLKQPAPGAVGTAAAPATQSAAPPSAISPEVVLGPKERWFVSADFSFDSVSANIGKDPTPEAEQVKAKDFFVALNFAVGDLLADRTSPMQRRSFLHELLVKVQATPSKTPWEAWAVGIGLRGYRIKTILWNLDVAHPYVAVGRQAVEGADPKLRVVFGIGFDPRSIGRE